MEMITSCEMQDLEDLHKKRVVGTFILCSLAGAGKDFPKDLNSYRALFARLVDKAIFDYCEVRRYALLTISDSTEGKNGIIIGGRPIYVHVVANHIEDCVSTTRRLFRYFEKIKGRLPVDRVSRRYIESLEQSVREVRDIIEHMDDDIHKGLGEDGNVLSPSLSADCKSIQILKLKLSTDHLAHSLEALHKFGMEFMQYKYENGIFVKI